jgi:hypothetical protein
MFPLSLRPEAPLCAADAIAARAPGTPATPDLHDVMLNGSSKDVESTMKCLCERASHNEMSQDELRNAFMATRRNGQTALHLSFRPQRLDKLKAFLTQLEAAVDAELLNGPDLRLMFMCRDRQTETPLELFAQNCCLKDQATGREGVLNLLALCDCLLNLRKKGALTAEDLTDIVLGERGRCGPGRKGSTAFDVTTEGINDLDASPAAPALFDFAVALAEHHPNFANDMVDALDSRGIGDMLYLGDTPRTQAFVDGIDRLLALKKGALDRGTLRRKMDGALLPMLEKLASLPKGGKPGDTAGKRCKALWQQWFSKPQEEAVPVGSSSN